METGEAAAGLNWSAVALLALIAAGGEAVEFFAGAAGAAKKGGSRRAIFLAVIGTFAGSITGAVMGLPVPVVGSLIGALAGVSMPIFWLGLVFMLIFSLNLGWLPLSGRLSIGVDLDVITNFYIVDAVITGNWPAFKDAVWHIIMPAVTLSTIPTAIIARMTRSSMLEVLRQDYIKTAKAKGLSQFIVIFKHALRNALLPVITILGLSVPGLIGGSVIFETIFAIPGMGKLFYDGVMMRDYPLIMGILVIGAVLTLVGNLLADISYAIADPRIRKG